RDPCLQTSLVTTVLSAVLRPQSTHFRKALRGRRLTLLVIPAPPAGTLADRLKRLGVAHFGAKLEKHLISEMYECETKKGEVVENFTLIVLIFQFISDSTLRCLITVAIGIRRWPTGVGSEDSEGGFG